MNERPSLFVRATLVAKGLTPPYAWAVLKALRRRVRPRAEPAPAEAPAAVEPVPLPEWEYVPEGWERPEGGWDVGAIVQAHRDKWPSFLAAVEGTGPLGVFHETPLGEEISREDLDAQQMVLAFGYVLARAAAGKSRLSVLDWGAGPGHYAVLARALLPEIELDYHSRDLAPVVALGRELLPGDTFHADDACLERSYDLVVASSSIQYAPDWRTILAGLARATGGFLYVTRVPVALDAPSFVVLQRAHRYGYDTEFLGWVLNRDELLAAARDEGLELMRELILPAWLSAPGAAEDPIGHRGFLFASVSRENAANL
jgi:putative methyltransferase (TIGR04325 family)